MDATSRNKSFEKQGPGLGPDPGPISQAKEMACTIKGGRPKQGGFLQSPCNAAHSKEEEADPNFTSTINLDNLSLA